MRHVFKRRRRAAKSVTSVAATPRKPSPGYVYLIKGIGVTFYKIGRAKNVAARMNTFDVKLPFDIEVIHTIKCSDYKEAEKRLHWIYRQYRKGSTEWFDLPPEAVAAIKLIKEM